MYVYAYIDTRMMYIQNILMHVHIIIISDTHKVMFYLCVLCAVSYVS